MYLTHYQKLGILTTILDKDGEFTVFDSSTAWHVYDILRQHGWVRFEGNRVLLTEKGRKLRQEQLRK